MPPLGPRLVVLALVTGAATTACGRSQPAPEAQGRASAHEDVGATEVDPNTVYLNVDGREIVYNPTFNRVIACERSLDAPTLERMQSFTDVPHVVLAKPDGTFEARLSEMPEHQDSDYGCDDGPSWSFHLWEEDAGFLRNFDVSGEMVNAVAGKQLGCEGGFQLHKGIDFDVRGLKVENGVLRQPDVTISIEGSSIGIARAQCRIAVTTPRLVFFAGPVPVFYELSAVVALEVSVSKESNVRATFGTQGGELVTDDPELGITPQLELGVTFYNALGAYIGVDFPITVSPRPPCTPEITLGAALKVGVQAGIIGVGVGGGNLSFTKALGAEINTPVLGPFTIAESRCE